VVGNYARNGKEMQLVPQRMSRFPLLLCSLGLLLLLVVPILGRQSNDSNSVSTVLNYYPPSDEMDMPIGEDHWMDADIANTVLSQWLTNSPTGSTITVNRREVVWIRTLVQSAARQAKAGNQKKTLPGTRKVAHLSKVSNRSPRL
jgi:hypothetical protein